jgi:hypothetical protein
MMQFVKAFSSAGNVRAFLTSRTLFNELLCFEVEMGNFIEAAGRTYRKCLSEGGINLLWGYCTAYSPPHHHEYVVEFKCQKEVPERICWQ